MLDLPTIKTDFLFENSQDFNQTAKLYVSLQLWVQNAYPLNLVLENWEYLWFYLTFWIVILDYGLKLNKLSIHTLVMLQKWLEIH